jgi:hypothetical protein
MGFQTWENAPFMRGDLCHEPGYSATDTRAVPSPLLHCAHFTARTSHLTTWRAQFPRSEVKSGAKLRFAAVVRGELPDQSTIPFILVSSRF